MKKQKKKLDPELLDLVNKTADQYAKRIQAGESIGTSEILVLLS